MSEGWIMLHRQLLENPMWKKEPFTMGQAWVDLLLMASHKDSKFLLNGSWMIIKRGQLHTSTLQLADRWKWSRGKVTRYLDVLETDGMITQKRTSGGTANGTTLTIVKYDDFQCGGTTDDTTSDTTNGQRSIQRSIQRTDIYNNDKECNKNENNEKNEKNKEKDIAKAISKEKVFFPNDEELNQTFLDYIKMRKEIKKPMSDKAITLALNKLDSLSGGDNEKAIQILNQSIFHSWQGLFDIKEQKDSRKEQTSFFDALNACH